MLNLSRRNLALCAFFCFASGLLLAQAAPAGQGPNLDPFVTPDRMWHPHINRDQQALDAIHQALQALGGNDVIGQIVSLEIEGQATDDSSKQFVWQTSGANYRMLSKSGVSLDEVNSGSGSPFHKLDSTTTALPSYRALATFVPAAVGTLLNRIYGDPGYSVLYAGQSTLGAEAVIEIRTASESTRLAARVTAQTWYFSASTGLPVRLEYNFFPDSHSLISVSAAYDFSGYVATRSVNFPHLIAVSIGGRQVASLTITSVALNPTLPSSLFASFKGGAR